MPAKKRGVPSLSGGALVFTHLHCHSHYSFLRGVASPEEIVAAAAEQNMPTVALTDTNGLFAQCHFIRRPGKRASSRSSRGAGRGDGGRNEERIPSTGGPRPGRGLPLGTTASRVCLLVLLATDMEGYSNLCQLVTLRHLGTTKLAQNAAGKRTL